MSATDDGVTRELLHRRAIECHGYRRSDGLWDIEGRLTDEKTYPFANQYRGEIQPGDFLHDMTLTLTLDDGMRIHRVSAGMGAHPYPVCPEVTRAFAALEGLVIAPGWSREMRKRVGGVRGCSHLTKLLDNLAVAAFQTIVPVVERAARRSEPDRRPPHIDGCHAMRSDGPVVKEHYPRWYRTP
ncbi:MAG: DUF2889 domain-containing protein [Gammaproteobacteria bacterium]|jgi:hypothetical protein